MSKNPWAPRQEPVEYRSRCELADAMFDSMARLHRELQTIGALSERVRALETKKAAPVRQGTEAA